MKVSICRYRIVPLMPICRYCIGLLTPICRYCFGSNLALEITPQTGQIAYSNRNGGQYGSSNREAASKASDALGLGAWRCRRVEPQAPRSGAWGGSTSDKAMSFAHF